MTSSMRVVALQAARLAGNYALRQYDKLKSSDIYRKSKHDLVTKTDLGANKIIIRTIKRRFSDHDFLSEETGLEDNPGTYQWIIDPLDGTTNYKIHNPFFCISLTLVYRRQILLSVIYAPYLKEFYYAERGRGVFLNKKRIHVNRSRQLGKSIVLLGRSHHPRSHHRFVTVQHKLKEVVLNMRSLGSNALNLAYVASGRVEACIITPPGVALWDSLAGVLLVKEAGGTVTDYRGRPWQFNSQGVIAAPRYIHRQLMDIVRL